MGDNYTKNSGRAYYCVYTYQHAPEKAVALVTVSPLGIITKPKSIISINVS